MLVAASSHTLDGRPDRDMDFLTSRNESGLGDRGGTTTVRRDMFTFPAGSRAGIFFHEILEAVDFSLGRHPGNEAIIEQKLGEFGFDADWRSTVAGMIEAVGSVPIAGLEHGFTLQQVAAEDRIHEMEFYHALKPLSPGLLREVFERFAPRKAIQGFPERLERLAFRPSRGFMKGYIDMIVCHEGRFFLLDWKSNYLGDGYEHYHVSRLSDSMRNEFYILQYHLYTLALHLYLRQRVAGYDYQKHFGGVAYIFIRGVARSCGCDSGIYTDRPALTLIHALGQALVPDYE